MVRIITDGTSDLTAQMAAELGVHVMPMRVFFGQESFVDGVDITREEFFARLTASDELPSSTRTIFWRCSKCMRTRGMRSWGSSCPPS